MNYNPAECEMCYEPAEWHVRAQWSLFDYDERRACKSHTHEAIIELARRWVDDEPVRELLVDYIGAQVAP